MKAIIPRNTSRIILLYRALPLLLVLAGCGEAPSLEMAPPVPTAAKPAADAARLVFLGNSLTAGLGLPEAEAFPAVVGTLLQNNGLPVVITNAGVSGDTSAGGLTRLDWVLRQRPHVLVVELGGNDALRGQSLESTEANLREIVRGGRAAGAHVMVLGMDVPTNYGPDYAEAFAQIYPRLAEEEGATLVPAFVREVGSDPSLLQSDGLHPTADGHRRLAETLLPYLEEAIGSMSPGD